MALQFIDQAPGGIGSSTRRLIRSHVMQGKNKGKQRRPTKKPKNADDLKRLLDSAGAGNVIPRQVLWGDLCLVSFPQDLDSESLGLMHRCMILSSLGGSSGSFLSDSGSTGFFDISDALFPPQFCTKFDILKSIWVNCILADEACECRHCQQLAQAAPLTTATRFPWHIGYLRIVCGLSAAETSHLVQNPSPHFPGICIG